MSRKKLPDLIMTLLVSIAGGWLFASAGQAGEGLAPYPSFAAAEAEVRDLAQTRPEQVQLFIAGKSAGDHDLLLLRVHKGDGIARPAALIGGGIHGDEYIGNRTAMAAAAMLAAGDDPLASQVLQRMDVYILPLINPDGYAATWESEGKGPAKKTRTNQNGVDLNRNFGKPKARLDMPLGYSGSRDPDSTRYVGPAPVSEPEAKAVRDLAQKYRFFAAVDFHSSGGMIIPALDDDPGSHRGLAKMARAYRQAQANRYLIVMFPWWLPIYQGSMEECLYREAGTLAVLIELGQSKDFERGQNVSEFWGFNPRPPETIARIAKDNARAALAALLAAFEYTEGKTEPRPGRELAGNFP